MTKTYEITVPISGLAHVVVEAESAEEAMAAALDAVTLDSIEEWEPLEHVNQGNVCYAMKPWEITIDCEYEND